MRLAANRKYGHPLKRSQPGDLGQQPALADPGLATNHIQARLARAGARDVLPKLLHFGISADKRKRGQRRDGRIWNGLRNATSQQRRRESQVRATRLTFILAEDAHRSSFAARQCHRFGECKRADFVEWIHAQEQLCIALDGPPVQRLAIGLDRRHETLAERRRKLGALALQPLAIALRYVRLEVRQEVGHRRVRYAAHRGVVPHLIRREVHRCGVRFEWRSELPQFVQELAQ